MQDDRIRDQLVKAVASSLCTGPLLDEQQEYREALARIVLDAAIPEIATWLRHIDRLGEVPGAADLMPRKNPLWDAANLLERETLGEPVPR